jgi:hypothetical protein
MTTWFMRIAYWIPQVTNTHSEYVTFIAFFFTATMVEGTRLDVNLYGHWMSCLKLGSYFNIDPRYKVSENVKYKNVYVWLSNLYG